MHDISNICSVYILNKKVNIQVFYWQKFILIELEIFKLTTNYKMTWIVPFRFGIFDLKVSRYLLNI